MTSEFVLYANVCYAIEEKKKKRSYDQCDAKTKWYFRSQPVLYEAFH